MSQRAPNNIVIIGQFGRPHGVKGSLRMQVFGGEAINLVKTKPWLIQNSNGEWHPVTPQKVDPKTGYLLVKMEGIDDREQAESLTNKEVAIYANQLPELKDGEYYWYELIGLDVINQADVKLGVVKDLMATGSNDVLVLDDNGTERLVPYLPGEYVLEIDLKARQIKMDWDEDF